MKDFAGKVAVITGGAGGIGYALAERAIEEGMKVIIADIDDAQLAASADTLREEKGGEVEHIRCDVSKSADIKAMANKAIDCFGGVHFLANNAGVFAGGSCWETSENDWDWTMSVNLNGVFNGIRIFAPIMLAQDCECHILNTASGAGLMPYHPTASYQVSKAGVVSITENTHYALKLRDAKVTTSVLCPGFVATDMMQNNETRRPKEMQNTDADEKIFEQQQQLLDGIESGMASLSITPREMADQAFEAIKRGEVYINAPSVLPLIEARMKGIVENHIPPGDPFSVVLETQNQ
jgi:NAD(P)-dependent dehydrogenase (short-subunit alcohol dehydrogenase family)|tara:strand:+ start:447 stop:1328 length:882 start_codon:yes stop_codon:yes gene_type:complete